MIRFGPSGLGGVKEAEANLEKYHELGLKACEIAFTYGIYIKNPKDALKIRKKAEELDINLSVHAQYWINLNSKDKDKIIKSKERILNCCKIGDILGAKYIVFHPGFYGKKTKEETYENIKNAILEIQEKIKEEKLDVKLAPETMGKINVFGSVQEIKELVKDTGCSLCVDFAHLYARNQGKNDYKELYKPFKSFNNLHCHFSGIEYEDKGEKRHMISDKSEIKRLLGVLPKTGKNITIINESPSPVKDSVMSLKIYKEIK
jgi:deoxyribonuclease-4